MKLIKTFLFSAICLTIFSGCISEDLTDPEPYASASSNKDVYESDGIFMNLAIGQIGTTGGTKAPTTDVGNASECAISHGGIYIFAGKNKTEDDAVCVTYADIYATDTELEQQGAEFSTKPIYFKNIRLKKFTYDETEEYYVLIILNPNTYFKNPVVGQTFAAWAYTPQQNNMLFKVTSGQTTTYITMANATGHINHSTGAFSPKTLVRINRDDIQKGEFPEDHITKTTVYVQRNVAKVIVRPKDGLAGNDKLCSIGDSFTLQVNYSNFYLDKTNQWSYPVLNIKELDFSATHTHSGAGTFDRVYWAKDPNYSSTDNSSYYNFDRSRDPYNGNSEVALYCLENTMDYNQMLRGQTTRVIVRGGLQWFVQDQDTKQRWQQIVLPDDYIWSGEPPADRKEPAGKAGYNNNFDKYGYFKIGNGNNVTIFDRMHLEAALQAKAQEKYGAAINIIWYGKNDISDEDWKNIPGNYYTFAGLISLKTPDNTEISGSELDEFARSLGLLDATTDDHIAYYQNGTVYYDVRIRHFMDDEGQVKWDGSYTEIDGKKRAIYNLGHLGRFGVLRNNYYDMVINAIHNVGEPTPPTPDDNDTDDDPYDFYLDITVQIRDWNKRQQGFEF